MKRFILVLTASALILSCSNQEKEISVGFVGVYSGRYSEVGVSSRNGAALAVEELNKAGGILGMQLTYTALDDKNNKVQVADAFEQHIAAGRKFIIGPNISHLADETKHYASKENLLIISPTMSTDKLSGLKDNFIRVISVTSAEGKALSIQAILMNYKRAAVIYDISNAEYTEPIYQMFKENFEKDENRQIVYVNHVSSNIKKNFLDMAAGITATRADMVLILTTAIDAASIAQQIRKMNNNIQMFAARWAKTLDIVSNGGSAVEGMIFASMYTPKKRTEKYIAFVDAYRKKFNTPPSFVSAYAYEAVMVLADGIRRAGSTNIKEVRKAIVEAKFFDGLEERFSINEYGDAVRKTSLVQIVDGVFEVIND